MNTRKHCYVRGNSNRVYWRRIGIACALLRASIFSDVLFAQSDVWLEGAPCLQRVTIGAFEAWSIDYTISNGIGRALVTVDSRPDEQNVVTRYYLFGRGVGVVQPPEKGQPDPKLPERWAMAGSTLLATWNIDWLPPGMNGPRIVSFPLQAFSVGPDGVGMLDGTLLRSLRKSMGSEPALEPIGVRSMGLSGWSEGDELVRSGLRMGDPPKVIHYDFLASGDNRLELLMTADGRLQRWSFDGEKWKLAKEYSVELRGPFLVCDNGASVVAEWEGQWSLIGPLDAAAPQVSPVVKRKEGTPLVLIEDTLVKKNYFELEGKVYDASGVMRGTAPASAETPEKVKAISDLIRSLRKE